MATLAWRSGGRDEAGGVADEGLVHLAGSSQAEAMRNGRTHKTTTHSLSIHLVEQSTETFIPCLDHGHMAISRKKIGAGASNIPEACDGELQLGTHAIAQEPQTGVSAELSTLSYAIHLSAVAFDTTPAHMFKDMSDQHRSTTIIRRPTQARHQEEGGSRTRS